MKYLSLILVMFLSACGTAVPIIAKFPDVPPEMLEKCQRLKTIDSDTTVFSVMSNTIVDNYTQYHICANKSDSWIEWYNTQKKIYENVK